MSRQVQWVWQALGIWEVGENLTCTASLVLSLRSDTSGETTGTQGGFDIVESKREVGQKHFFPGLETNINIRWRGSTFLVCKGESCGGKM